MQTMKDDVRSLYIVRRLLRAGVSKQDIARVIRRHPSAVTRRAQWWNAEFERRGLDVRI